jgi:adenylate kinase
MRLVLVGPPGSGKGTQAELLVKRLGLTYVGTGEILRDAIRRQTDLGKHVEQTIKQGLLVSDPIVNDLVAELFRGANRPERFVMDGYPRTLAQAVAFDALLRQQFLRLDAVVNLAISDDEVVRRISGRWCCSNPACAVCFHLSARPPKAAGKCDVCGAALLQRIDDREETVRRRLAEFYKTTDALLEHYDRLGLVRNVSALDGVETIYGNILKALPQAA